MRASLRLLPVAIALSALSACAGEPFHPDAGTSAGSTWRGAGVYMGSGLSVPTDGSPAATSDSSTSRGSGYIGTGF